MLFTYFIIVFISFLAGALFEDFQILRDQKKHGFTYILGKFFALKEIKINADQSNEEHF